MGFSKIVKEFRKSRNIASSWAYPGSPFIIVFWREGTEWRAASDTHFFKNYHGLPCTELDLFNFGWRKLCKGYFYERKESSES